MATISGPKKGKCERCGKYVGFGVIDYCVNCSKDLCPECMAGGCCGHVPAESGHEADDQPMSEDEFRRIKECRKGLHPDD